MLVMKRFLTDTGVPDRNRTCNPQLRRLVLYPVELRAQFFSRLFKSLLKPGRGGEIRTPDILLPKQARYQATLHPEGCALYRRSPENQFSLGVFLVLAMPASGSSPSTTGSAAPQGTATASLQPGNRCPASVRGTAALLSQSSGKWF